MYQWKEDLVFYILIMLRIHRITKKFNLIIDNCDENGNKLTLYTIEETAKEVRDTIDKRMLGREMPSQSLAAQQLGSACTEREKFQNFLEVNIFESHLVSPENGPHTHVLSFHQCRRAARQKPATHTLTYFTHLVAQIRKVRG